MLWGGDRSACSVRICNSNSVAMRWKLQTGRRGSVHADHVTLASAGGARPMCRRLGGPGGLLVGTSLPDDTARGDVLVRCRSYFGGIWAHCVRECSGTARYSPAEPDTKNALTSDYAALRVILLHVPSRDIPSSNRAGRVSGLLACPGGRPVGTPLTGRTSPVNALTAVAPPDRRTLHATATASDDQAIILWRTGMTARQRNRPCRCKRELTRLVE